MYNALDINSDDPFDQMFLGTPKSKFWDIARGSNDEIVMDELDKVFEKYAAMELMLSKDKDDSYDINRELKNFIVQNQDVVNNMKDGLYIEFTGEIVCRLDS